MWSLYEKIFIQYIPNSHNQDAVLTGNVLFLYSGCLLCDLFVLYVYVHIYICTVCTVCTVHSRYLRAPKGMSSMRLVPRLSNLSMGSESIMKLDHVNRPQGLCNCLRPCSTSIRNCGRRFSLLQYMYVEYIFLPVWWKSMNLTVDFLVNSVHITACMI